MQKSTMESTAQYVSCSSDAHFWDTHCRQRMRSPLPRKEFYCHHPLRPREVQVTVWSLPKHRADDQQGCSRQSAVKKSVTKQRILSVPTSESRPVLTDYAENRKDWVNDDRLTSTINNCEHFGTCPGCVVNEKVGDIDIISWQKYSFRVHQYGNVV
jgi:hypothetical protein